MELCGKEIRIKGRIVRIASLDGEGYQFLEDPEAALTELRKSRTQIDLFTFIQKLSDTSPKYSYPLEWDNFASLRISSFDDWMARLRPSDQDDGAQNGKRRHRRPGSSFRRLTDPRHPRH